MPSLALQAWRSTRAQALDEIEEAHRRAGGLGPGRRYTTQQINQAYVVLLSAQFQGFCRDLHTECAEHLRTSLAQHSAASAAAATILGAGFTTNRRLSRDNPTIDALKDDFGRFGFVFWRHVELVDPRKQSRQRSLQVLNEWRNAIAHQSIDPAKLGGRTTIVLSMVRKWRRDCDGLAESFDTVMRARLRDILGSPPW